MNILLISGSQRTGSFNTKLIKEIPALVPEHTFTHLDYSELPLFNQDLEESFPESALHIKKIISTADAVIISTPEHNRTMPAALTNLLSWTGRPYGQSAWTGISVFVTGVTGGVVGTALAQTDLRKVLLFLGAHVMGQPESYIGLAGDKFKDDVLVDENTKDHLKAAVAALAAFAQ